MASKHLPILADTIVESLMEPFLTRGVQAPPHWLVDCTLGGGGHTARFLERFATDPRIKQHKVLALDQDSEAVHRAKERFSKEIAQGRLEVLHQNFGDAGSLIRERPVLALLADLGFSSDQLEDQKRGLSFQWDGPLDMRLDPSQGESCYDLIRTRSEAEIEKILSEYGEERFSKRIATHLVEARRKGLLPKTTKELVDIVVRAVPRTARHGKIHVATRTFQGFRIAVNRELEELDRLLFDGMSSLVSGGRAAILSFHSLEDRKVKLQFKNRELFLALTKKPIEASDEEVKNNPRARSAKLRIAQIL